MSSHFNEVQKFKSWWIRGVLLLATAGAAFPVIKGIMEPKSSGSVIPMVIVLIIICAIAVLIFRATLEIEVDKYAIKYKYSPFINQWKRIEKAQIVSAEVVKYSPIREFGGYGYRVRLGKGKALNVKGNMGLKLVYDNQKKLLLGTQKPEELKSAIISLLKIENTAY